MDSRPLYIDATDIPEQLEDEMIAFAKSMGRIRWQANLIQLKISLREHSRNFFFLVVPNGCFFFLQYV